MDSDGPNNTTHLPSDGREQVNMSTSCGGVASTTSGGEAWAAPERCRYTAIPRSVRGAGMSGVQLTQANLDKSALLVELFGLSSVGAEANVLGELQFAFVTFLVGQSLEGTAAISLSCVVCLVPYDC